MLPFWPRNKFAVHTVTSFRGKEKIKEHIISANSAHVQSGAHKQRYTAIYILLKGYTLYQSLSAELVRPEGYNSLNI